MELVYIPGIILSHRESFIKLVYIGYIASRYGGEWTQFLGTLGTTCVDLTYIQDDFDFGLLLASMYCRAHSNLLVEEFNPFWYQAFQFGSKLCTTLLHCRILLDRVY